MQIAATMKSKCAALVKTSLWSAFHTLFTERSPEAMFLLAVLERRSSVL